MRVEFAVKAVTNSVENSLPNQDEHPLSPLQRFNKRIFDVVASMILLILTSPLIFVGWIASSASTRASGFYIQQRVGRNGELFPLIKLRTMRIMKEVSTTVTSSNDCRITKVGAILRKLKIDELPQLLNVIAGHMSLVGPRPDVPGFADQLEGQDRILLQVRPGVTGPASVHFRNEEEILANVEDPETYNRNVIWPEKVRINLEYLRNYSFMNDLRTILVTAIPALSNKS